MDAAGIVALVLSGLALVVSLAAAYYTRMQGVGTREQARLLALADQERRRPPVEVMFTDDSTSVEPFVAVRNLSERTLSRVTLELCEPEPDGENGFGRTPPRAPSVTLQGPIPPRGVEQTYEPIAFHSDGNVAHLRAVVEVGHEQWVHMTVVELPTDLLGTVW